jgi:hypothetical protein
LRLETKSRRLRELIRDKLNFREIGPARRP